MRQLRESLADLEQVISVGSLELFPVWFDPLRRPMEVPKFDNVMSLYSKKI